MTDFLEFLGNDQPRIERKYFDEPDWQDGLNQPDWAKYDGYILYVDAYIIQLRRNYFPGTRDLAYWTMWLEPNSDHEERIGPVSDQEAKAAGLDMLLKHNRKLMDRILTLYARQQARVAQPKR